MHEEVTRIELVHSAWIDYERAGDLKHLLALCADGVEFWPRNASPIVGLRLLHGEREIAWQHIKGARCGPTHSLAAYIASDVFWTDRRPPGH